MRCIPLFFITDLYGLHRLHRWVVYEVKLIIKSRSTQRIARSFLLSQIYTDYTDYTDVLVIGC